MSLIGFHPDLPAETYHSDPCPEPSLSASGIKKLLDVWPFTGCPAAFDYWRKNPEPPKDVYDFGKVCHRLLLGAGDEFQVIGFSDYKTKVAQEERNLIRASGKVPVLQKDMVTALAMREEALKNKWVRMVVEEGRPEVTMIWQDDVWNRARADLLLEKQALLVDYKTCESAHPDDASRVLINYGYFVQAAHYCEGAQALGLGDGGVPFGFIFQEKTPPYLCAFYQPDTLAVDYGAAYCQRAKEILRKCIDSGEWPGYSDDKIKPISAPHFALTRFEQLAEADILKGI